MIRARRLRIAGLMLLTTGLLACGTDEPLDPELQACLDTIGPPARSGRFAVERDGRLCRVTLPSGCTASRREARDERLACETVDFHAGEGTEAIGFELTFDCDDEAPGVRVWGYLDKKMPRLVAEAIPLLHGPSTLPNCAAAFYLPGDDDVGWVARELTFFPGDDRPLVTERARWDVQLRAVVWEHRPDGARESETFLDDVFPYEFEEAVRSRDPAAADWVRIDVPGAQRLTYERHPTAAD